MHWYFAFGLTLCSPFALPELMPAASTEGDADVVVRFGPVSRRPPRLDTSSFGFWCSPEEACHTVDGVGAFLVRGGREILIDPEPGADESRLRLSLLGPALGLVLHQRGLLVLHASVVAHEDDAVAFVGGNGSGKSTLAAALHRRGWDVVSDDLAAVRFDDGEPVVLPGFPQFKLWPEAASLLGHDPQALPLLHPGFDKRAWRPRSEFSRRPRRLTRIDVVTPGAGPGIERVEPREVLFTLLSHWYGHRFGGPLLEGRARVWQLDQCARLAATVTMHRLRRSGGSDGVLRLASIVDDDLRRDVATPPCRGSRESRVASPGR